MLPKSVAMILYYLMFIALVIFIYRSLSPNPDDEFQAPYRIISQSSDPTIDEELLIQMVARIEVKAGIVIAAAVCNMESPSYPEVLVMVKSAVLFQGSSELTFIIFCERDIRPRLAFELEQVVMWAKYPVSVYLTDLWYPEPRDKWVKIENRMVCSCLRLFLPALLTGIKHILYVDTDVVFLNNVSEIWAHIDQMQDEQIIGATMTHESTDRTTYYAQYTRTQIYGTQGLNTGVLLMNLDKMRAFQWVRNMVQLVTKYWFKIRFSEQDLINSYLHQHPDQVYILPCRLNFRLEHCVMKRDCADAMANGISLMHGRANVFKSHKLHRALFGSTYDAFMLYDFSDGNPHDFLLVPLQYALRNLWDEECHEVVNVTLGNMERHFRFYFDPTVRLSRRYVDSTIPV